MSPHAQALDELRQQFQFEGFGNAHYQEAALVVQRLARRYPAAIYSPNGTWDEDAVCGMLGVVDRIEVDRTGAIEAVDQSG